MNEFWGKVHFWPSLICMNVIFLPMFLQGMLGMHRRWYDGGQGWNLASEKVWGLSGFHWNMPISIAAWVMGLAQIPFIINFFWSIKHGEESERQSVGSDHAGMDGALAAAARKFRRQRRWCIAGPTNTACPGRETGFHDAKRTGRAERTRAAQAAAAARSHA